MPRIEPTLKAEQHAASYSVADISPASGGLRFGMLFKDYHVPLLIGSIFLLLTNVAALYVPRRIKYGIDAISSDGGLALVQTEVLWIIGLAMVGGITRILSRMYIFNIGRDIERDVRSVLFRHTLTACRPFFAKYSVGDTMSRLTNDLQSIRALSGFALLNVINAAFIFIGTLPVLFAINTKLALLALIPFPLVMGMAQMMSKTMFNRTMENQKQLGALNTILQQNLNGQMVVRAFGGRQREIDAFEEVNKKTFQAAMRLAMVRMVLFPLMGLMSALSIAIALYVGGQMAARGELTVGDIVEFNTRIMQLAWPAMAGGFIIAVYHRGKASLERVNELLNTKPTLRDGTYKGDVPGELHFDDVGVQYMADEHTVEALKHITLDIHPGEFIGMIGTNASGKSTVVDLLTRQLDPTSGEITVDGQPLTDWNLSALRDIFAVVPEQAFLLSQSIRENLCLWDEEITEDDITQVLSMVDLKRDLDSFPDGLETLVGERGWTLSGGQRQRVALARAILRNAPCLIMDDALSAVDAEVEAHIIDALRTGFRGRRQQTLIVIAHRPEAIRTADRILVFDEGEIVERGRHEELIAQGGLYARLVTDRSADAEELEEVQS